MSHIFLNNPHIEVESSENTKSQFLISEVLLGIKESSSIESVEEEVIKCNSNDLENSSNLLLYF
jgi:hypothetical protein